jgi:hypothetical protein
MKRLLDTSFFVKLYGANQSLTGNLTGTPTDFSRQSRTSVNTTPLQEPLGGRPRTAMDSRCRIPPFGMPNILFEPYQNSSEATSILRFLYYHFCTATVPQRQHRTGSIFRQYQRISVNFPDNEQALFPGPNRLRQKNQDHPVRFGTGRLYHLSTEDDQRLSQERVFRHEFGSATHEARDVIGCSQEPYLAVRCHK